MNITVRNASADDAKEIIRIVGEGFRNYCAVVGIDNIEALDETADDVLRDIKTKSVFVAEVRGRVEGTLRLSASGEDSMYLSRFAVSDKFRGRGVGAVLMREAYGFAKEHGAKRIYLCSALKDLYTGSYGFTAIESDTKRGYERTLFVKEL